MSTQCWPTLVKAFRSYMLGGMGLQKPRMFSGVHGPSSMSFRTSRGRSMVAVVVLLTDRASAFREAASWSVEDPAGMAGNFAGLSCTCGLGDSVSTLGILS